MIGVFLWYESVIRDLNLGESLCVQSVCGTCWEEGIGEGRKKS